LAVVGAQLVAIVGTRAPTNYGVHVAGELAVDLAERGWLTVSGGAYGIDAAAHRGALAAQAPTVAVLACGLDVTYPKGHERLFDRIAEDGLLVSEWPPGSSPMRHRFLVRNRIIAALGAGTVVVEAGARSGTANTVAHARRLDRPIMAVPGAVTSAMSVGCHALLRHDARLVTNAAEVVEEVGRIGELAALPIGAATPRDELSAEGKRVLDAVPKRRAAPPGRIAVTCGLSIVDVTRALGALETIGLVQRTLEGYRVAAAPR
ncbi:MAG: DNA-processing protein DprA, partial [Frankia sp.]|nr:DNA-processing protein DprA [Frankia sp.]